MACLPAELILVGEDGVVGQNFIRADRDTPMLLPVDMQEWLPQDDIAHHVLDVVEQMDLSAFYADYHADGRGRAAFDPAVMVALLVYAHACGVRSSRAIERACGRDVGFRFVAGMFQPDHSTIARFFARHRQTLETLFAQVLRLCHEAGMTRFGVIAIDGTKVAANASWAKSYTDAALDHKIREEQQAYQQLAERLLDEQAQADAAEDAQFGDGRGDELPKDLRKHEDRVAKLKAAKADLAARDEQARAAMLAEQKAKQQEYDAAEAAGRKPKGPRPKDEVKYGPPPSRAKAPRASVTDPDSRRMKAKHGFVQGYNAQVAVTDSQVICAVLVTQTPTDHHLLPQVLTATTDTLTAAGIDDELHTVLADAGYANEDTFTACQDAELTLLAPIISDEKRVRGEDLPPVDPAQLPATAAAQELLKDPDAQQLYALRGQTVEPVFGQLKDRLGMRQLSRRGLANARAEITFAATVHNIRKLRTWKLTPPCAN
jgi:transposase